MWDEKGDCYGWFQSEPLEIAINVALCKSFKCLIKTLLHEYAHYLQHPEDWAMDYEQEAQFFEFFYREFTP